MVTRIYLCKAKRNREQTYVDTGRGEERQDVWREYEFTLPYVKGIANRIACGSEELKRKFAST